MTSKNCVILLSRELPEMFTGTLGQLGEVRLAGTHPGEAILRGATVYLSVGVDPVPAELIQRFPRGLGLIANIATGTDNIDLDAAAAAGIAVSNTPVVTQDTADLTMALLLATSRQLSFCERALRAGNWELGATHMGTRVHGKTLGIVGMGAIGQAVARRAVAFNMNILYHGPNPKPNAEAELGVQYRETLSALLAESDIVSINCPLTTTSHHLFDARALGKMKQGAILINTGRGPLIDESALVDALRSGHLGGAGLDVFEFEPTVNAELMELDNVTLLPHIGSATGECRMDMAMRALGNIKQFLDQGKPIDICLPK